ncbi:tight adherence protein B [Actinacidiphila guanduensis]|uniref:Tight adherence protein B n=1 Tax=Actinacidiphila guanduensis TaxID=310781 RepID=A0A1H0P292_9ACTN|nr:tight adherence protein B [Actinacidiphila guanduensis]
MKGRLSAPPPGAEWLCAVAGAVLGAITWSPVPLVAGSAAAPLARRALQRRAERALGERTAATVGTLCGTVAGDLRAGRPPNAALADAVQSTDWAASSERGEMGRLLLSAARFGGDVPEALRTAAGRGPGADGLRAVAACWQVAVDGGAGLAAALDRVAAALRAEADQREDLRAQLAGPRSTAALLAMLPAFGLVLGTAMGARPTDVLLHTPAGLALLGTGLALEGVGLVWTARIIAAAEGAAGRRGVGAPNALGGRHRAAAGGPAGEDSAAVRSVAAMDRAYANGGSGARRSRRPTGAVGGIRGPGGRWVDGKQFDGGKEGR